MDQLIISDDYKRHYKKFRFKKNFYLLALNIEDHIFLSSKFPQKNIKSIEEFITTKIKKKVILERDRLINQLSSNIENKEILNVPKFDQNYYLNFFDLFFTSKKLTKILSYNYNIELHKNFFNTEINGHHSSAKIIVDQVYKNLKNKNKNFVCKHYFNKINLINKGKKWAYFLKRNILAYYNLLVKKNLIKKKII